MLGCCLAGSPLINLDGRVVGMAIGSIGNKDSVSHIHSYVVDGSAIRCALTEAFKLWGGDRHLDCLDTCINARITS